MHNCGGVTGEGDVHQGSGDEGVVQWSFYIRLHMYERRDNDGKRSDQLCVALNNQSRSDHLHPVREGTWVLQMIFTQVNINVYPKRSRYCNSETGIYKNRGYDLNLDYELSAWSYLFRLIDIYPYASNIRIAMDLACTMAHLAQKLKGERNAVKVALVRAGSNRRRVLSPIDMKDEAIYLYKYMKCSQLPRIHGHTPWRQIVSQIDITMR